MGPDDWEGVVLDLADAFKQLTVAPEERRHIGGRALGGVICYSMVTFGIKSGPLVWGRVAALLMRLTCILQVRLQCFVDDPLMFLGGKKTQRDRLLLRTVLLWLALGFKLSWKKGARGRLIEWIGSAIKAWTSPTGFPGVEISVTADRVRNLAEDFRALLDCGDPVLKARVRPVAGLGTRMAGVVPQMSAFSTMLWAAASCGDATTVSRDQVKPALWWLVTLCEQNMAPVERHCRQRPDYLVSLRSTAHTGGGATLQVGLHKLEEGVTQPIVSYMQGRWSDEVKLLQVDRNSPSGQARLEAYTFLVALTTWRDTLVSTQGAVPTLGDALGVLYDVMKLKARDVILNTLAGEMALSLSPIGMDTRTAHLRTQLNCVCDALSRLNEGQESDLPQLRQAVKVSRRALKGQLLRTLFLFCFPK